MRDSGMRLTQADKMHIGESGEEYGVCNGDLRCRRYGMNLTRSGEALRDETRRSASQERRARDHDNARTGSDNARTLDPVLRCQSPLSLRA